MSEDASFPIISSQVRKPAGIAGRRRLEDVALILNRADNVAVARRDLAPGLEVAYPDGTIVLRDPIPAGHKLALRDIPKGMPIVKYAHVIGAALCPIRAGEWVHIHNVSVTHSLEAQEYAVERRTPPPFHDGLPASFLGYRRKDGSVGTRNHIAVVAASNCASHVCERIAGEFRDVRHATFDGVAALPHPDGCGAHDGPDIEQLIRTIKGIILNPNVAAVLMVGLGCEINALSRYAPWGVELAAVKPFAGIEIQSCGGTLKTIEEGARALRGMIEEARSLERTEVPVSSLVLGLNCGGSDAFSGITANPALGRASDLLVAAGGTVVLAETPEIYGAEHTLTRRAVDADTGRKLIHIIRRYQEYVGRFGATLDSNPSPGNRSGGITNIVEKSLAAVMKGGSTALTAVYDYAERVTAKGLVMMDTPGYDPPSLAGIAAGGCTLIAFTTGRGSAIGFPVVPVLKIASNTGTYTRMKDNMDVDAGEILDGGSSIEAKGTEIYLRLIRTASGERTKAEILGHAEFVTWRIGPVM